MRGISQTYLRYAIEIAFLAEQAYEFEADKQINVIRFDYDLSSTAGLLAADFLLKDLDTLEQNLVVSQQSRQQHVRCTVSLARDFPDALQQLRNTGSAIFTVPLRLLERRFPGLYKLRIGSVEVLPLALLDPTRFSLELTSTGASQIRLKGPSGSIPGTDASSWLPPLDAVWPTRVRLSTPETAVYSGLSRAEEQSVFPFATANQRSAFEGLGAAASWSIDMSMEENQVVPQTLADILITINLSGYYDPALRAAIETSPAPTNVLTQYLSAQQTFPDAFYEFQQTGTLKLSVTRDLLSIRDRIGRLRNLGIILSACFASRRAARRNTLELR